MPKECYICGWNKATIDVHHIYPTKLGGKSNIQNLVSLCPNHHRIVHNKQLYTIEKIKVIQ